MRRSPQLLNNKPHTSRNRRPLVSNLQRTSSSYSNLHQCKSLLQRMFNLRAVQAIWLRFSKLKSMSKLNSNKWTSNQDHLLKGFQNWSSPRVIRKSLISWLKSISLLDKCRPTLEGGRNRSLRSLTQHNPNVWKSISHRSSPLVSLSWMEAKKWTRPNSIKRIRYFISKSYNLYPNYKCPPNHSMRTSSSPVFQFNKAAM